MQSSRSSSSSSLSSSTSWTNPKDQTSPENKANQNSVEYFYGIRINKKTTNAQTWDKQHYCKYCEKPVLKLPRHLQYRHATEPEVMAFLELPPKDAKRREIIDNIRNEGNFLHNQKVLSSGTGELHTKRRLAFASEGDAALDNYIVCSICHVAVLNRSLASHRRKVHLKRKHKDHSSSESLDTQNTSISKNYRKECERFFPVINGGGISIEFKRAVLSVMRNDAITITAKQDELILDYGQRIFAQLNQQEKKSDLYYISQKMRELARLLMSFREFVGDENCTMRSILNAEEVPNLISTIKVLAKYDTETEAFKKPTLAKHCAFSVKQVVSFAKEAAIEKNDEKFRNDLDEFFAAYNAKWTGELSRLAASSMKKNPGDKDPLLPFPQDVQESIQSTAR